jgi:N-acetylglucosaminyldiphosphoundecaprenol N-acetyl-beta-D-mannosaminyltransferase
LVVGAMHLSLALVLAAAVAAFATYSGAMAGPSEAGDHSLNFVLRHDAVSVPVRTAAQLPVETVVQVKRQLTRIPMTWGFTAVDIASSIDQPVTMSDPGVRRDFLGAPIDCLTMAETIAAVARAIRNRRTLQHVCINVAKFVAMRTNAELDHDVRSSHIVSADGMGIVWAARLLGITVPGRVAGIDVMEEVIRLCAVNGYRPFFLGARPEVLQKSIANIRSRFPGLELAGWGDGYFRSDEEREVVAAIKSSRADCLFIGMPTPRKERFLARHRDDLGVPFIMGVGGALDVLAGHVRRAPPLFQKLGLEWLFRAVQEPLRLGPRYLKTNAAFAGIIAKALTARLFSFQSRSA